jgi:hypothetical protein
MSLCRRKDPLVAAKVEVGRIFKDMLSVEDAAVYMESNSIPPEVSERVLNGGGRDTRQAETALQTGASSAA